VFVLKVGRPQVERSKDEPCQAGHLQSHRISTLIDSSARNFN
jgi:hypothetical protein